MTKRAHNARLRPDRSRPAGDRSLLLPILIGALIALGAVVWGAFWGFGVLSDVCNEQCRIADTDTDVVVVTPGKMVKPDVVLLHFGLTNGANLAEIDFAGLRAKLLARVPNVRDLRIERRRPNRVTIEVREREPIARVRSSAKGTPTGLMTDAEGVLFRFVRGTAAFPVVRVTADVKLAPGERLTGRNAAALRLLEAAADPELLSLNVQEADASPKDYVGVTLGNYSRAKVAWERMDDDSHLSRESLHRQLTRLSQAMASGLAAPAVTWMVLDYGTPGRVYAAENAR